VHKAAKKVSLLIVYLGNQRDYQLFTPPTLVLCKSIPMISALSRMTEKDNFKEGEFDFLV
jgi:hypothetical protein